MRRQESSPLVEAFLEDHRKMTRLLYQLTQALKADELARARALADELDQQAGPHIAFEETFLYPLVAKAEGQTFFGQLCDEHQAALRALRQLLELDEDQPMETAERERLMEGMKIGLNHAESCGTLVSHLSTLAPESQSEALKQLEQFRRERRRWTELPNPTRSASAGMQ